MCNKILIVDCVWRPWTIGKCSVTCGGGKRINARTKSVEESHGGTCSGLATETKDCNTVSCTGKSVLI